MARHPWVAQADAGVRFGVEVIGARGVIASGPADGYCAYLTHADPLKEMLTTARLIEDLGFDAVFVPETPRTFPDPFVALTALALTTRRVRLGSSVIVPAFRHPALLARMAADVDRLSGGRLILGLGIGETEGQFLTVDARWGSPSTRQAALSEAIEVMTGVWGAESFSYRGRHYQTEGMRVSPGPLQQPHPPLLIGGAGDRTLAQVAHYADACNLLGGSAEVVRAKLSYLNERCDEAGRPRDEVLRSYIDFLVLAPTEAEANAKQRRFVAEDVLPVMEEFDILMVGTPEQVVARHQALIDAGIQYFISVLADTADHETLHLLATDVIPHLRA